jgi:hypothetical protein
MALGFETYNQKASAWKDEMVNLSKSTAKGMGINHRSGSPSPNDSVNKIRGKVGYADGIVNRISISFPRQLIWPQKGAGKGMAGSKGSRWIDSFGNAQKTNPQSFGKMNTGNRKEKPFINTALDSEAGVDKIATIAAEEIGYTISNNLFIS